MNERKSTFFKFFSNLYIRFVDWVIGKFLAWRKKKQDIQTKTILIVDDTIELTNLIKYRLEDKGFYVVIASDGIEALSKLKKIDPILIVLDVNMPKMGGMEFFKNISTKYGKPKYPVLFLTSRADLEGICRDIEADGFLAKPFEIEDLMNEIDRIISGHTNPVIFLFDCPTNPKAKEIASVLKEERYDVVVIDGAMEFQNLGETQKPSFILLEYMQKDISGEDLIKRIKYNEVLSNVPIIAYSYSGFGEYKEKSLAAGASRYLDKPESIDLFVAAIKELKLGKEGNWKQ